MTRLTAVVSLLFVLACGSSEPPATTQTAAPVAGEQPAEADHEHHRLTPELDAFHALLSPLWHADKGEARRADACKVMPDFKTRAAAVKSAAPPASVEATGWSSAGTELEDSVAALATACSGADAAAFETAFEAVHTRFHHAMELVAGEHEASGEHSGW